MFNNEQWGNIGLPGLDDDKLLNTNWNFAKTENDKLRRSQTLKQVAAQRDETYYQNQKQGCQLRDNTYQAENLARPEVRAKLSARLTGREKTAEHIAKVAEKSKERALPCITPLGVFRSGVEAGLAYNQERGVTNGRNAVCNKLKKGVSGYRYISVEEYIMLTGKEL